MFLVWTLYRLKYLLESVVDKLRSLCILCARLLISLFVDIKKERERVVIYSTVIAWVGQAGTQAMHKMQSSALSGTALLSTKSNTFVGQTSTQTPSPLQASETVTVGIFSTYF